MHTRLYLSIFVFIRAFLTWFVSRFQSVPGYVLGSRKPIYFISRTVNTVYRIFE
ncbi:hypothetical protein PAXRUDRAFT_724813 [Paxillus rubicundulus Ve08.2h10]|uniref:Unplaced genomic scaffold scaffold_839, whole genome shotgun sequence n=1 Tax=Paxillus rubicundulus Ve08.2h10 TaxID=930991 RepID=A0A0D0DRB7_9AGAM|nr:hypothetical protein PAXRUDRAFT_724813 [Paxillus rubicundulus Ve08.2h10]